MTPQDDNAADLAFLVWLRAAAPTTMIAWTRLYEDSRTRPAAPRCEKCNGTGRVIDRDTDAGGFCDCQMGRDLARVETRIATEAGSE